MAPGFQTFFQQAGCDGELCVQSLDGANEVAERADELVVAASVIKVCVALEAETQFCEGRLNPADRVRLPADRRTPGNVGFSLFDDDVEVSLRDLVVAMLTISDNVATDALLAAVGIDAVNAASARLGLSQTVITSDIQTLVNSIWQEAGFAGWNAAMAWHAEPHSQSELDEVDEKWRAAPALTAASSNRTTPRDMATLMRLIWTDQAGPQPACARLRWIMSRQLTRHRLASGFAPPARVAAKSGGLVGVVRNEVGVVTYPDGRGYAMAVFTQTQQPGRDAAINAVIGTVAAAAVQAMRGSSNDR